MLRTSLLPIVIVSTYAVSLLMGGRRDWLEYILGATTLLGPAAVVASSAVPKPFAITFGLTFATALLLGALSYLSMVTGPTTEQPWVMAPPLTMVLTIVTVAITVGATGGGVALGLRTLGIGRRARARFTN